MIEKKALFELNKFKNDEFDRLWKSCNNNSKLYEKLKKEFLKSSIWVSLEELKKELDDDKKSFWNSHEITMYIQLLEKSLFGEATTQDKKYGIRLSSLVAPKKDKKCCGGLK